MTPLLQVEGLEVGYETGGGVFRRGGAGVRAVAGVDLALNAGEVLALVGESGCGKTTVARALVGLLRPSAGRIRFAGRDVEALGRDDRLAWRRAVQMVFQDPFDSLNPRKTALATLAQPLRIHRIVPRAELRREAARLLDRVGLSPGAAYLNRYPHQFSGGQRQRICIARAIAVRPQVIVADEPVSALDVSIRAQILTLFQELSRDLGLATIFITHDLTVVRSLSDRVAVMYLGRIVEEGPTDAVFALPRHPYTAALLAASPIPDPVLARRLLRRPLGGDVPSPADPPGGCAFHPRCAHAAAICGTQRPVPQPQPGGGMSACHFAADAPQWARPHDRILEEVS
ncbi:MAG: ATP-binding cassette domain-containing protein [Alphaproteobacteria bacterium]|nr:ATP-binding cassette domain-containing protein [Alphaproteobacteria bacterium]